MKRVKMFLVVLGALTAFGASHTVYGQVDDVLVVKQKARTAIRPKAKPATTRINVTRNVPIVRVSKKSRTNYKKPVAKKITPVQVPLLAAQLRLLTVDKNGNETEVNPIAQFTKNDRLRLSIKTNQRGYLYVIRQSSPEDDGEIIFPTTLVNNGSNYIAPNLEYVIPRNCPTEYAPKPRDCALELLPFKESPQEYFTLIFTRDSLVDLPSDVRSKRVSLQNLMSAGRIPVKTLVGLIEESGQDLVSQTGDSPFAIRIVNVNAKDNEEIIETFVLTKMKK